LSLVPAFPSIVEQGQLLNDVTIGVEPRNYPPEAWQELVAGAPLPVIEKANWSGLPALIYTLSIPVVWGAVKFAGSFFERLGAAAADGLVTWIKGAAESAKEPNREALVEIRFYVQDGGSAILGFAPLDARSDGSAVALSTAIDQAGLLAEFA